MSKTFRGGFIGATAPTVNTTSASGIFTLGDALQYRNSASWPVFIRSANVTINSTNYSLSVANTIFLSTQGYYTLLPSRDMTLLLQLWGAGGGGGGESSPSGGGAGGYVEGNVTLTSGVTYVIIVGKRGLNGSDVVSFPDGGPSGSSASMWASGGGSSRFGPYTQSGFNITNNSADYNNTNAVYYLIAGGGGSGSNWAGDTGAGTYGGYGGGTTGASGGRYYYADSSTSVGLGGSQSAGGAGGYGGRLGNGSAGAKYSGGAGGGSGGGGGYYGGGGAAGYYSTGGGGSGYIHSNVSSGIFYTTTSGSTTYNVPPDPRSNRPGNAGKGASPPQSVYSGYDGACGILLID